MSIIVEELRAEEFLCDVLWVPIKSIYEIVDQSIYYTTLYVGTNWYAKESFRRNTQISQLSQSCSLLLSDDNDISSTLPMAHRSWLVKKISRC